MIKDNRKTKENSKNQEQFINYIEEYFAEAPITISNDKTKIYIVHNDYPISLENTEIIEQFTNKNKGIEFTKEQAIKEAERLRNELAIEVKNYKAEGISIIQNLIKEHLKVTFGAENITDIKFIGDYEVSFKYNGYVVDTINYTEEVNCLLRDNTLVNLELLDFEDNIESFKYDNTVEEIVDNIVAPELAKLEGTNCSVDYSADEINIIYNNAILEEVWIDEGYSFTVAETINYITTEVKSIVAYILSSFAEQAECAKYAEENYKTDVNELLYNTECYLLNQNPDAEISLFPDFHTDGFYNHDFRFKLEFDIYELGHYEIDIDDNYGIFDQNGFWYSEDTDCNTENCELYNDKVPWSPKINYSTFLETVREELFKLEEEILEDLS